MFILPNELIIINSVYSTRCRVVNIQSERLIETSLSDGVNCTHSSCVANLLYKFELIVISGVYSTQCRVVNIQPKTADCDITECWSELYLSSGVANLLCKFELIIINSVYSIRCRVVNIQSERLIETSLSDGVNRTHSSCVANIII